MRLLKKLLPGRTPSPKPRQMVMIQWPSTLDSACALALVQEEVGDAHRSKDFRRSAQFFSVASYKSLSSPSKFDKSLRLPMPDEAQ
jgi:hypothetical protein